MEILLSKQEFIGGVNSNTPDIVIRDILASNYIKIDNLDTNDPVSRSRIVKLLSKIQPIRLKTPFSRDEQIKIATFLNPDSSIKWNTKAIANAFSFTYSSMTKNTIYDSTEIGYPTVYKYNLLSPAIAYGILSNLGIRIASTCTLEQLKSIVNSYHSSEELYRYSIINAVKLANNTELLGILSYISNVEVPAISIDSDKIRKIYDNISNSNLSQKYYSCDSHEQAVALAAMFYNKNIIFSSNPIAEYTVLTKDSSKFPITKKMREIYSINPHAYDIRSVFSPLFPINAYSLTCLANMINKISMISEGMSKELMYETLSVKYFTDTFYRGVIPDITTFETPIELEDIRHTKEPIVSYGSEGKYTVYLISELITMFTAYQNFQYSETESFSSDAIESLVNISKLIIKSKIRVRISNNEKQRWISLMNTINNIKFSLNLIVDIKEQYRLRYDSLDEEDKLKLTVLLVELFSCAMYMRGWKGEDITVIDECIIDKLPLSIVPDYDADEASGIARDKIEILMSHIEESGNVGEYFSSLPLLRIYKGNLMRSTDPDQGLTIQDRIQIVWEAKSGWSCIKMSSNWFLVSSYIYLKEIGYNIPYDISTYEHI